MTSIADAEALAIARIAAEYEARGYVVLKRPTGANLPPFLASYSPDLIARGPTESVVIDVRTAQHGSVADKLSDVARDISSMPGWRLEVVAVPGDYDGIVPSAATLLSRDEIALIRIDAATLYDRGATLGAFFLYWSVVEAILRRLATANSLPLERLPTSRLLGELSSQGVISRSSHENARNLLAIRNRLSHGYAALPGEVHVEELSSLVDDLLAELDSESEQDD
jgi:REase_AHJR-like